MVIILNTRCMVGIVFVCAVTRWIVNRPADHNGKYTYKDDLHKPQLNMPRCISPRWCSCLCMHIVWFVLPRAAWMVSLTRARFAALTTFRKLAVGIPAAGWSQLMNSCVLYASSGHFFRRGNGGSLHVPAERDRKRISCLMILGKCNRFQLCSMCICIIIKLEQYRYFCVNDFASTASHMSFIIVPLPNVNHIPSCVAFASSVDLEKKWSVELAAIEYYRRAHAIICINIHSQISFCSCHLPNWFVTGGRRMTSGLDPPVYSCQRYVLRYSEWSWNVWKQTDELIILLIL